MNPIEKLINCYIDETVENKKKGRQTTIQLDELKVNNLS